MELCSFTDLYRTLLWKLLVYNAYGIDRTEGQVTEVSKYFFIY